MKSIRKVAVALCLAAMVGSAYAADVVPADKLLEIMARGRMIIAVEAEYPPMSELIKGAKRSSETKCLSNEYTSAEFAGFETEVTKELARRLGVEACFVAPPWAEIISGKWADRWDIAIDSVSITSERMESLYFAQPYSSEPTVFFVHKNNTSFKTPADLSGKKIGVCAGCTFEHYLDGTLTLPGQTMEYPVKDPDIMAYDVENKSFADLALGDGTKLDAVLTNVFIGNKALSDGIPIRQLGEPVFYTHVAPAIDKKHSRNPIPFVKKISELIMQLHDDGTLTKLAEKYFSVKADVIGPAKKFDIQSLGQYQQIEK